jgi:hypothetical protein
VSDYSKCDGRDCSVRHKCIRYVSMPDPRCQSWIDPSPRGEACTYLLERRKRPQMVDVSAYSRAHLASRRRTRDVEVSNELRETPASDY